MQQQEEGVGEIKAGEPLLSFWTQQSEWSEVYRAPDESYLQQRLASVFKPNAFLTGFVANAQLIEQHPERMGTAVRLLGEHVKRVGYNKSATLASLYELVARDAKGHQEFGEAMGLPSKDVSMPAIARACQSSVAGCYLGDARKAVNVLGRLLGMRTRQLHDPLPHHFRSFVQPPSTEVRNPLSMKDIARLAYTDVPGSHRLWTPEDVVNLMVHLKTAIVARVEVLDWTLVTVREAREIVGRIFAENVSQLGAERDLLASVEDVGTSAWKYKNLMERETPMRLRPRPKRRRLDEAGTYDSSETEEADGNTDVAVPACTRRFISLISEVARNAQLLERAHHALQLYELLVVDATVGARKMLQDKPLAGLQTLLMFVLLLRRLSTTMSPPNLIEWALQDDPATRTHEYMHRASLVLPERLWELVDQLLQCDRMCAPILLMPRYVAEMKFGDGAVPLGFVQDTKYPLDLDDHGARHWIYHSAAPWNAEHPTMFERMLGHGWRRPPTERMELALMHTNPLQHPDPLGAWVRLCMDVTAREMCLCTLFAGTEQELDEKKRRLDATIALLNQLPYELDLDNEVVHPLPSWPKLRGWAYLALPRRIIAMYGLTRKGVGMDAYPFECKVALRYSVSRGHAARALSVGMQTTHNIDKATVEDGQFPVNLSFRLDALEAMWHLTEELHRQLDGKGVNHYCLNGAVFVTALFGTPRLPAYVSRDGSAGISFFFDTMCRELSYNRSGCFEPSLVNPKSEGYRWRSSEAAQVPKCLPSLRLLSFSPHALWPFPPLTRTDTILGQRVRFAQGSATNENLGMYQDVFNRFCWMQPQMCCDHRTPGCTGDRCEKGGQCEMQRARAWQDTLRWLGHPENHVSRPPYIIATNVHCVVHTGCIALVMPKPTLLSDGQSETGCGRTYAPRGETGWVEWSIGAGMHEARFETLAVAVHTAVSTHPKFSRTMRLFLHSFTNGSAYPVHLVPGCDPIVQPTTCYMNEEPRPTRFPQCYVTPSSTWMPIDEVGRRVRADFVAGEAPAPDAADLFHTFWYVDSFDPEQHGCASHSDWRLCAQAAWTRLVSFCERLAAVNPCRLAELPVDLCCNVEQRNNTVWWVNSLKVAVPNRRILTDRGEHNLYYRKHRFHARLPLVDETNAIPLAATLQLLRDVEEAGVLDELPADFLSYVCWSQCECRSGRCLGLRLLPFMRSYLHCCTGKPLGENAIGKVCSPHTPQQYVLELMALCLRVYDQTPQNVWFPHEDLAVVPPVFVETAVTSRHGQYARSEESRTLNIGDAQFMHTFMNAMQEPAFAKLTFRGLLRTGRGFLSLEPHVPLSKMRMQHLFDVRHGVDGMLKDLLPEAEAHGVCSEIVEHALDVFDDAHIGLRLMGGLAGLRNHCSLYKSQPPAYSDIDKNGYGATGLGLVMGTLAKRYPAHYCMCPSIVEKYAHSAASVSLAEACHDTLEGKDWSKRAEMCLTHEELLFSGSYPMRTRTDMVMALTALSSAPMDVVRLATSWDYHLWNENASGLQLAGRNVIDMVGPIARSDLREADGVGMVRNVRLGTQVLVSPATLPHRLLRRRDSRYLLVANPTGLDEFVRRYLFYASSRTLLGQDGRFALLPLHPAYLLFLYQRGEWQPPSAVDLWLAMESSGQHALTPEKTRQGLSVAAGEAKLMFPGWEKDQWDNSEYLRELAGSFTDELRLLLQSTEAVRLDMLQRRSMDPARALKDELCWLRRFREMDPGIIAQLMFADTQRQFQSVPLDAAMLIQRMQFPDEYTGDVIMPHYRLHNPNFRELLQRMTSYIPQNTRFPQVVTMLTGNCLYYVWTRHPDTGALFKLTPPMLFMMWLQRSPDAPALMPALAEMLGVYLGSPPYSITRRFVPKATQLLFARPAKWDDSVHIASFCANYDSAMAHYNAEQASLVAKPEMLVTVDTTPGCSAWVTSVWLGQDDEEVEAQAREEAGRLPETSTCHHIMTLPDYLTGALIGLDSELPPVDILPSISCFCGLNADPVLHKTHHGPHRLCTYLQLAEAAGYRMFRTLDCGIAPSIKNPYETFVNTESTVRPYDIQAIFDRAFPVVTERMQYLSDLGGHNFYSK